MQSELLADPEIMHGTPCFRGTRVPVSMLFNWLHGKGISIDEFVRQFPTVRREQIESVLRQASSLLESAADKPESLSEVAAR